IGVWKCHVTTRKRGHLVRTCRFHLTFDKYDGAYYWGSSDSFACTDGYSIISKYKFWIDHDKLYRATYWTSSPASRKYLGDKISVMHQGNELTYGYERESGKHQYKCSR